MYIDVLSYLMKKVSSSTTRPHSKPPTLLLDSRCGVTLEQPTPTPPSDCVFAGGVWPLLKFPRGRLLIEGCYYSSSGFPRITRAAAVASTTGKVLNLFLLVICFRLYFLLCLILFTQTHNGRVCVEVVPVATTNILTAPEESVLSEIILPQNRQSVNVIRRNKLLGFSHIHSPQWR